MSVVSPISSAPSSISEVVSSSLISTIGGSNTLTGSSEGGSLTSLSGSILGSGVGEGAPPPPASLSSTGSTPSGTGVIT